jgi:hypothetical protein
MAKAKASGAMPRSRLDKSIALDFDVTQTQEGLRQMKHPLRLALKAGTELTVREAGCLMGYAKRKYLGGVMLPKQ